METKIICSMCKSENIKKDGKRKTENRGLIQRYKCLECNKRFVLDDGFFRMRNSPQKITQSVDLFYRGASTRGVQGHLAMFYPHNADHSTILRWIIKYSNLISNYTNKLNIKAGNELMSDEVEYRRRKSHKAKAGIEPNWFVDVIDININWIAVIGILRISYL